LRKEKLCYNTIKISLIISILLISGCFEPEKKLGDATDFTLTTINGEKFTLSKQVGKIVVIDFMFTTCYPCQLQMSELKKIYEKFKDDITLISISVWWSDDEEKNLQDFKNYYQAEWIFALDTINEDVTMKYYVNSVPKIVIIDKNGNMNYSYSGFISNEILNKQINEIL
jgi:cytochrome oxidase Cu insertion factor (SCO1/SenC/PrrC family)